MRILILAIIITFISCGNDNDIEIKDTLTTLIVNIEDADGNYVADIPVYAYNETTWATYGDDPEFADFEIKSDDEGVAVFNSLTTDEAFNDANGNSQTYMFSVHYTIDGVDKTKERNISFNLGDDKTTTIVIN